MSQDLLDQVSRRLGVAPNELEPVLQAVVQRIRQQVAHFGYARVSGLGTFRGHEGELHFEPDAVLIESVNHRYAGLKAIHLGPALTTSAPAAVPPIPTAPLPDWPETDLPEEQMLAELDEDQVAAEGADEPSAPESSGDEPLGAAADALEDTSTDEVETYPTKPAPLPPFAEVENAEEEATFAEEATFGLSGMDEAPEDREGVGDIAVEHSAEQEVPVEDSVGEDTPVEHSAGQELPAEDFAVAETDEDDAARMVGSQPDALDSEVASAGGLSETGPEPGDGDDIVGVGDRSRRNAVLIVVGVLILIAAGIIGFFALQPGAPDDADLAASRTEENAADQAGPADTNDAQGADDAGIDSEEFSQDLTGRDAVIDAAEPELEEETGGPATPSTTDTPLRSANGIDEAAGGFTLIVFSDRSRNTANEVAQRFAEQGFRTGVLSSEDGPTRFRVGVGQFETLEEAVAARDQLAGGELPADAWVHRLQ